MVPIELSSKNSRKQLISINLGTVDYSNSLSLQKNLHSYIVTNQLPNLLLLLEHNHVYTLGRRGSITDVFASSGFLSQYNIKIHHADRGGEVTYHGPGQLVGYPILNIRDLQIGPVKYVRSLEDVLVQTLAYFEIDAHVKDGITGVWVGQKKIASIGVKISRGVTYHGFALNVSNDLSFFDHIVACGLSDIKITSVNSIRPDITSTKQVLSILSNRFAQVFDCSIKQETLSKVLGNKYTLEHKNGLVN